MIYQLRDYQQNAADTSIKFLNSNSSDASKRLLWAAPTGSGKSLVKLVVQSNVPGSWIVTPRIEIIVGLLEKLGYDCVDEAPEQEIVNLAFKNRIGTPIRLANRWMAGELPIPSALILDEAHHDNSESWQNLHAMTQVPAIGFTATPYRGTPQETAILRRRWGSPVWMISPAQADRQGYISMPFCMTEALVDDDVITVTNGEFAIRSLNTESLNKIEDAARFIERFYDPIEKKYDRSTLVTVPSSVVAEELSLLTPNSVVITKDTPRRKRLEYFRSTEDRYTVLIHINVVSEGVDLRLRRLIDFSPTMSPVRWIQQLGRITRPIAPGEERPVYVCLNRNLLRHAYILNGVIPNAVAAVKQAEEAFKGYGKRPSGGRVFGTEGLGRIQGTDVKLLNGMSAVFYAFARTVDKQVQNFAVIFHPLQVKPVWAMRIDTVKDQIGEDGKTRDYGKWELCEPLNEGVIGFCSLPARPPSKPQLAWWERSAHQFGLDPMAPNTRQFQILPVLKDLGLRIT